MQKPVTIKSVAAALGLSFSTVSKALNDYPDISDETKKIVSEKAVEMGYTPNPFARNLVKNTSNSIGVIIRDIANAYGELFKPLSFEARKHNLNLIVADSNRDVEEENRCLQTMIESHVRGIIIAPVNGDYERINQIVMGKVPVVFLGNSVTKNNLNYVAPDSKIGTVLALEYLYKLGHRDIALVADSKQSTSSKAKLASYREFMASHNLVPALFVDSSKTNSLYEAGYQQAERMLSVNRVFSAVYAIKDEVAIGVMGALKDAGKEVPEDISVIGYDGSKISGNPLIGLTTVAMDMEEFAEKLVSIVLSSSDTAEHHVVKLFIVERKSCGVPRLKNRILH